MNKLWIRLSLAFGIVIAIGLIMSALLANWRVSDQFRRFVADNQMAERVFLLDALTEYYARYESWAGVETIFETLPGPPPIGNGQNSRRHIPNLILADADGNIVYDPSGKKGARLRRGEKGHAIPVAWQDQTAGYLLVRPPGRGELSQPAQGFLRQVNLFLIQAGLIAGSLGIALGLTLARGLTAPLGQLAEAARRISQGKLDQRVPVKGPEEVADLALAFNDMSAALAQGEKLRRNLVADVAHELRTPLSVIQGNLRAILDDVFALDKTEVARLYDQTRLLSRLVNDLHELAQAEARQLPLDLQPTDLSQLVITTAEAFRPVAEAGGIALKTVLGPNIPPVEADPARLRQVLHNLLVNALHHTPAGGTITLALEASANTVRLAVVDSGDGISAEHLPHIFDRFYRADPARSRDKGNAGLGLAIARAIIEAHGGQVAVTSEGVPGCGSTFTISLPVFENSLSAGQSIS